MNRYISDYTIFQRINIQDLQNDVKLRIVHGWEPIGGIAVGPTGLFYQAIVKYSIEYSQSTGPR